MSNLCHTIANLTFRQALAFRMRRLRTDYGHKVGRRVSQAAFGALLGVEEGAYGSYERGDRQPPLAVLLTLRRVTGVNLNELLADVP